MLKIFLFLLVLLACEAFTQENESNFAENPGKIERKARDRYLGLGLGTAYIRVMDQATSPLMYQGLQIPAAKLDYLVHSARVIKTFEADFSFGNLRTRTETPWYDPTNTSYFVAIRYNQLYRIKSFNSDHIHWYIGPEINFNGHFRINYKYGNSAFTFDNYNGIGIASRFEMPLSYTQKKMKLWFLKLNRRDRDLRLSWQLSMPLASFVIRPTYVTITNFIQPELQSKITSEHTGGGFLVPLNIRSQAELYYVLHNQNMIKLSYIWNFYHHKPDYNKVQSVYHGFLFSLVFKFNQNKP
ncbi:MAG: hypothetical protein K9G76_11565 [Bacteroidales bacterium]|nr:hypothetical protein [Bacteroidales bacterium]MCF8405114.1 hypothetical protein [Bacteroidales bacterium]